jgi:hypothetical protein
VKTKREVERDLCRAALPMLELPPSTTREGNTLYQHVKRQLEKQVAQNPLGFRDFWLHYDASQQELLKALDQPCLGWFRSKKDRV